MTSRTPGFRRNGRVLRRFEAPPAEITPLILLPGFRRPDPNRSRTATRGRDRLSHPPHVSDVVTARPESTRTGPSPGVVDRLDPTRARFGRPRAGLRTVLSVGVVLGGRWRTGVSAEETNRESFLPRNEVRSTNCSRSPFISVDGSSLPTFTWLDDFCRLVTPPRKTVSTGATAQLRPNWPTSRPNWPTSTSVGSAAPSRSSSGQVRERRRKRGVSVAAAHSRNVIDLRSNVERKNGAPPCGGQPPGRNVGNPG